MNRKHGWLIALVTLALLVAACGPEMATPTPGATDTGGTGTATAVLRATAAPTQSAQPAVSVGSLVDPADWHALGSADAPVTLVEYSDFQ